MKLNSRWPLSFITQFRHDDTVSLRSSQVTCPCFHLLCASFLVLSSVRSSVFIIQASCCLCLLAWTILELRGGDPWNSMRGSLLDPSSLQDLYVSYGILSSSSLNSPKSACHNPEVRILFFAFFSKGLEHPSSCDWVRERKVTENIAIRSGKTTCVS